MKQQKSDQLDKKAASLWRRYPKSNSLSAQKAFWVEYDRLLLDVKRGPLMPRMNRQPAPKRLPNDLKWNDLLKQHFGLDNEIDYEYEYLDFRNELGCAAIGVLIMLVFVIFLVIAFVVESRLSGTLLLILLFVVGWLLIRKSKRGMEHTFSFKTDYLLCSKKVRVGRADTVEIPYHTIGRTKVTQQGDLQVFCNNNQGWKSNHTQIYFGMIIPMGGENNDAMYKFMKAVVKRNKELSAGKQISQ